MTILENTPDLPTLPESARRAVSQLLSGEFLGASRNIRQINDLFVTITKDLQTDSSEELVATLLATGDYLIATRGRNTPAIANAIRLALKDLDHKTSLAPGDVQALMKARRDDYNALSLRNAGLIAEFGANTFATCEVMLPFDYSSSMMIILKRLAERGRKIQLIVLESRCLDGGRPIAAEATAFGHTAVFSVDMAFSHFLRQTDAVLIGTETIFANGDCWNTIGSYPIALMAQMYQVPVYVATELIKIDPDSFVGQQKPIKPHDYSQVLNYPGSFERPDHISVAGPDLDRVPASLITGYITPHGVMPPGQIWNEAYQFLESINVSPLSTASTETEDRQSEVTASA
jgi:ribose 1,5-bisphosphate isomerase